MNIQQTTQENQKWHNFESVLNELSELIKDGKKSTPQLNAILENGLKIARKTDDLYEEYGKISKLRLYLLYKVIFELWSYQHQNIIENIIKAKKENLTQNSELFFKHKKLGVKIFNDFDNLTNIDDDQELIDHSLSVWRTNVNDLIEFVNISMVSGVRSRKSSGLMPGLSGISPQTKYVIFATFLLVLGIIIATLILIYG